MMHTETGQTLPNPSALRAKEAGKYLACQLGVPRPFSAVQMWAYARAGVIPTIHLGRRVWFRTAVLDMIATSDVAAYLAKGMMP